MSAGFEVSTSLKRLEQAKEDRKRAEAEVMNFVLDSHKMGYSIATISRSAGLSRTTIYKIIEEHA